MYTYVQGTCHVLPPARAELWEMADKVGIARKKIVTESKEDLVQYWLNKATLEDLLRLVKADTPSGLAKIQEPGSSTAPADASGSASSSGAGPKATGPTSVLAKLPSVTEDFQDETAFWGDTRCGPDLQDGRETPSSQLIEEGIDGIIPVAAVVKILQGLQEMEPLQQAAFLLAESCKLSKAKLERTVTRRVVMGTQTQLAESMDDERRKHPGLFLWGVVLEQKNGMLSLANGEDSVFELPAGTKVGRLDPLAMPTDLSKPQSWTVQAFLSFGEGLEA